MAITEQTLKECAALFFKEENPKKEGTKAYERYEKYKHAMDYAEFLELGGTSGDFTHDFKKGFVGRLQDQDFSQCAYHKNFHCSPCSPEKEDTAEIFSDNIPSPPQKKTAPSEEGKCFARVWCQVVGLDKGKVPNGTQVRWVSLPFCRCKNKVLKGNDYCKTHQKRYENRTLTMGDIRDEPHDFIGLNSRSQKHSFIGFGLLREYDYEDSSTWERDELDDKWVWKPEEWRKNPLLWHTEEWHDEQ
jgi:hypothetical protein